MAVASQGDSAVGWFENLVGGGGGFSARQVFGTEPLAAVALRAVDLDHDGDAGVVAVSYGDRALGWLDNRGDGTFSAERPGGWRRIRRLRDDPRRPGRQRRR